jgi:DNA-directed RNA polymerase specialized sigma24 family protein
MRIPPSEHEEHTSQVDRSTRSGAIRALIPELRCAARDLVNASTVSPDTLVQGALLVALRNWDELPAGGDLKPWLLGVLSEPGLVKPPEQLSAPPVERG